MLHLHNYQIIVSTLKITASLTKEQIDKIIAHLLAVQKELGEDMVLLTVDADAIAGMLHLKACIHHAIKAFQQKEAIANNLSAEIMLFLSGNRQISKAINQVGLTDKTKRIAVLQLSRKEKSIESAEEIINDFLMLLNKETVTHKELRFNVKNLAIGNEEQIMANLTISEEEIALLTAQDKKDRSTVLQQLALEKSALLNINK
jgi:tRNA threonylcarbamoyladenosine modification (KEOPS) complex Cgi121 subunit